MPLTESGGEEQFPPVTIPAGWAVIESMSADVRGLCQLAGI
jgi:hypothetical protein